MNTLEVQKLSAYYKLEKENIYAVDQIDFSLKKGECLGIAGESGCGKSTLALSIMGYTLPPLYISADKILVEGKDILGYSKDWIQKHILGCEIAYIPQAAMNALNPTLKIKRFALDLLKTHGFTENKKSVLDRAATRLRDLGLDPKVLDAYPNELSGGMKQRTVIALSTLLSPKILIADEPTSALDVSSQKKVILLLKTLLRENYVQGILFITHELPLLYHIADTVMVMYAGECIEYGPKEDVLLRPKHPYSKALMQSVVEPKVEIKNQIFKVLEGTPPHLKTLPVGCRFYERCGIRCDTCQMKKVPLKEDGKRVYRCLKKCYYD